MQYTPDYSKTFVALIGSGTFERDPSISPIPNVKANLHGLKEVMTDTRYMGIPEENITTILDQPLTRTKELLEDAKNNARYHENVLIVYYAGHGFHGPQTLQIHLTAADSKKDTIELNGLRLDYLRDLVQNSTAGLKILIIDSCHSGHIHHMGIMSTLNSQIISAFNKIEGIYMISSAGENENATFDIDNPDKPTFFTEKLLEIVRFGIPNHKKFITLDEIYSEVIFRLKKDNRGHTPLKTSVVTAERFPFAKNVLYNSHSEIWEEVLAKKTKKAFKEFIAKYPESIYIDEAKVKLQELNDEAAFEEVKKAPKKYNIERFVETHPQSPFLDRAKKMLQEIEEEQDWNKALKLGTSHAYNMYLKKYPNGKFVELAYETSRDHFHMEVYSRIERQNTIAALKHYLHLYPDGLYRAQAENRIATLRNAIAEKKAAKKADAEKNKPRKLKLERFSTKSKLKKAIQIHYKQNPKTKILSQKQKEKLDKLKNKNRTNKSTAAETIVNKQKNHQTKILTNKKWHALPILSPEKVRYTLLIFGSMLLAFFMYIQFRPNQQKERRDQTIELMTRGEIDSAYALAKKILEEENEDTFALRIVHTVENVNKRKTSTYNADLNKLESLLKAEQYTKAQYNADSLLGIYPADKTITDLKILINKEISTLFSKWLAQADNLATNQETYAEAMTYYSKALNLNVNNAKIKQRIQYLNVEIDRAVSDYIYSCEMFLNNKFLGDKACLTAKVYWQKAYKLRPTNKKLIELKAKINC